MPIPPASLVRPRPRPPVGVPIHERRLTEAAAGAAGDLVPGTGTLVVLHEVEIGIGRPDLVVLRVDVTRLAWRRAAGLRLAGYHEAIALGALRAGRLDELGLSRTYVRRLERSLIARGWLDLWTHDRLVSDSLVLEAKVSNWRRALLQLSQVRWAAQQAALVVPHRLAGRIPDTALNPRGMGVLVVDDSGGIEWRRAAPSVPMPFELDAWLGELTLRELETSAGSRA
jgi:hypothetical protein